MQEYQSTMCHIYKVQDDGTKIGKCNSSIVAITSDDDRPIMTLRRVRSEI